MGYNVHDVLNFDENYFDENYISNNIIVIIFNESIDDNDINC